MHIWWRARQYLKCCQCQRAPVSLRDAQACHLVCRVNITLLQVVGHAAALWHIDGGDVDVLQAEHLAALQQETASSSEQTAVTYWVICSALLVCQQHGIPMHACMHADSLPINGGSASYNADLPVKSVTRHSMYFCCRPMAMQAYSCNPAAASQCACLTTSHHRVQCSLVQNIMSVCELVDRREP